MRIPENIKSKYEALKGYIPVICFFCGFIWDNLTLKRVDNTLDIVIFGVYILLSMAGIILIGRDLKWKYARFLPWAVQFFFGGLFSSFVVYYFKSASSLPSYLFILFLLMLLVANELFEKKYSDIRLSATLHSIAVFMYLNSVLPVLLHYMNILTFLLSIALAAGSFYLVRKLSLKPNLSIIPLSVIYTLLTVFYLTDIIPPVPLSKKEMGIYRSINIKENRYICLMQKPPWYARWKDSENDFEYAPGDTVFCFTSIYAPAGLKKNIAHHWMYYNDSKKKYIQTDKIGYSLKGGRLEGYRGYTFKTHVNPGRWKVEMKTENDKTLGVIKFDIEERNDKEDLELKKVIY